MQLEIFNGGKANGHMGKKGPSSELTFKKDNYAHIKTKFYSGASMNTFGKAGPS